jgi:hypothetical protein
MLWCDENLVQSCTKLDAFLEAAAVMPVPHFLIEMASKVGVFLV